MSAWVHLCFDSTGEMFVTDRAANTHFATISPNISNWAALSLFIWLKCNYKADMRQKNYMDLIFAGVSAAVPLLVPLAVLQPGGASRHLRARPLLAWGCLSFSYMTIYFKNIEVASLTSHFSWSALLQVDNRGNRLIVTDDSDINTPAVAAAYATKRYSKQAQDEISFEVGEVHWYLWSVEQCCRGIRVNLEVQRNTLWALRSVHSRG